MILRSKLYQIDNVVNLYFKEAIDLKSDNRIVKLKDISQFPSKRS